MGLSLMVGVNGAGKDTLVHNIIDRGRELIVLSGAQILMRSLGIEVGIEATVPPQTTRDMYLQLEQTPKEVKAAMRDTVFKDTLVDFRESGRTGVLFSQLVVALTLASDNEGVTFHPEDTSWYPEVFDKFVYVKASPAELIARRQRDAASGARDRGRIALHDLVEHQRLYDEVWSELADRVDDPSRMLTVHNTEGNLGQSTTEVERFLFPEG